MIGISQRLVSAMVLALAFPQSAAGAGVAPSGERFAATLTEDVRQRSFTGYRGVLHAVRHDGGPADVAGAAALARLRTLPAVLLLVHGSQYDPLRVGLPNPHSTFAHVVRTQLDPPLSGVSFGWYSAPWSIRNQFAALLRGSLSVYGLARRELEPQVPPLSELIRALPPDWSAICHSLGCELIRRALANDPSLPRPRRVLLLSGDLREAQFDRLAASDHIEVLAVRSTGDRPLARSHFRKDSSAFWARTASRTARWTDLMFYPALLEQGGRWSFRYRHRRRFWDHMATFEFHQPWDTYNRFLLGGSPLPVLASSGLRPL